MPRSIAEVLGSSQELAPRGTVPRDATDERPNESGWRACSRVLGCFMVFLITYGIATSFGVYQAHYELSLLKSYSSSDISWIGTVQVFLLGFVCVIAGPLHDSGHGMWLLNIGCGLVVFGLFMLSLANTYWQIMLSQSVCIGAGNGLIYVPAIAVVTRTFSRHQAAALGIAATGSSVGGTIIPIMFRRLVPSIGFAWTNRVLGFMILVVSLVAILLLREDSHTRTARQHNRLFDSAAFKEPSFVFLCLGLFFVELGFWIPPFTLTPYAELSLGTSADYAFYLLAIMNAGSFAGRVLPAYVAQIRRLGPAWILVAGALSLGILVLAWLAIQSVVGITIWAVFTGFMSGITVSIPNAVLPRLSPLATVGARSGMMWSFVAFAALIGAPIAQKLIDVKTGNYKGGQLFSGISICFGSILLCVPATHIMRKRSE